ncbi:MAG: hypothetical protein L7U62_06255 [Candidatus Poseidoniaceae archaeon]|nr:hypothetical protein [Candidatus Poseidoniaceae archaeon]
MNDSRLALTWRLMAFAFILPLLLIIAVDITLSAGVQNFDTDVSFTRFANATLTGYTLLSFVLLGNLFFYGESRNRPLAPLAGMLCASLLGIAATVFLIGQGPLLLEDNGSVQAQAIYNVVHTLVTAGAVVLATTVSLGATFSAVTSQKRRIHFEVEEE